MSMKTREGVPAVSTVGESKEVITRPVNPAAPVSRDPNAPEITHPETDTERRARLKALVKQAPQNPGVYLMRDEAGDIIYVGKAKNLRNRLSSYFSGKKDIKTRHLVSRIHQIEWVLAAHEYEALLIENNFIKEHSPRYNINLKDGKTYPSIRITNEEFPRVFRTRRIINDGSEYFGPFPSAETIDTYLDLIKRMFPLRRCVKMKKRATPCMYYHIGRCPGPCAGKISREDYLERVDEVRKLLSGDTESLVKDLEREMRRAAGELRFEEAARLREAIKAIQSFIGHSNAVDFNNLDARDYVAWEAEGEQVSYVVFQMREGKLRNRDSFIEHLVSDELETLDAFLARYYEEGRTPPATIFVRRADSTDAIARYLSERFDSRIDVRVPDSERHWAVMNLAVQNAKEELAKRRRMHGDFAALVELKEALGLGSMPLRIEGFDIAQLGGKHTVASLVSFRNGIPDKKNYRYFKIRSVEGQIDDFAAMREAVARRYTRLINEEAELPDLVLVDGGTGQVSAAKEILDDLGLDIDLAGLAKRNEEVWLPGRSKPVVLAKDSPALRVLVAVRDETHRFATGLSRKLRISDATFRVLQEVPGIGDVRAKSILREVGSLEAVAQAEPGYITSIAHVNEETARKVIDAARKTVDVARRAVDTEEEPETED
jgi:excinuclease ABC subunit C